MSETLAQEAADMVAWLRANPSAERAEEEAVLIERLAAANAQLERERDEAKNDYLGACVTVAKMHEAAMGEVCGPNRGVVEDIADLKAQRDAANAARVAAEGERARLAQRVDWLEAIREGVGRALCKRDGQDPDELISDAGHALWELQVYEVARREGGAILDEFARKRAALTPAPEAPTDGE